MTSTYTISLRVYQNNPNAYFHAVEKTVGGDANGTWTKATGGEYVLTMEGNGACGTIRFQADTGEKIVVAVGVDNYFRWCDIVQDVNETGATIQAQYYNKGSRIARKEEHLYRYSVLGESGRNVSIYYTVRSGRDLKANIVIE